MRPPPSASPFDPASKRRVVLGLAEGPGTGSVAILRETQPGVFEAGGEVTPYPMKVVLSMREADHLRHAWWFGAPGEEAVERVVAELIRMD
jgi:hypothetical protein